MSIVVAMLLYLALSEFISATLVWFGDRVDVSNFTFEVGISRHCFFHFAVSPGVCKTGTLSIFAIPLTNIAFHMYVIKCLKCTMLLRNFRIGHDHVLELNICT